jgi:hypothetical protein
VIVPNPAVVIRNATVAVSPGISSVTALTPIVAMTHPTRCVRCCFFGPRASAFVLTLDSIVAAATLTTVALATHAVNLDT